MSDFRPALLGMVVQFEAGGEGLIVDETSDSILVESDRLGRIWIHKSNLPDLQHTTPGEPLSEIVKAEPSEQLRALMREREDAVRDLYKVQDRLTELNLRIKATKKRLRTRPH